jgi:hypothetical protein
MASTTSEPTNEKRFGVAVSTGFRLNNSATGRTLELFLCPEGTPAHGPEQSQGFFAPPDRPTVRCFWCEASHPVVAFDDAARKSYIVRADTGLENLDGICLSANQIADAIYETGLPRKTAGPQAVKGRA